MVAVVGKRALERNAASSQTISRFETEILTQEKNIEALSSINDAWVEKAVASTKAKKIILDMDSSEFPVHGTQEGSAYNGHYCSRCYHPLFAFIVTNMSAKAKNVVRFYNRRGLCEQNIKEGKDALTWTGLS